MIEEYLESNSRLFLGNEVIQSPDLNLVECVFYLLKAKHKVNCPQNYQEVDSCNTGLAEHHQEET